MRRPLLTTATPPAPTGKCARVVCENRASADEIHRRCPNVQVQPLEFAQKKQLYPQRLPLQPPADVFCRIGWQLLVPSERVAGKWINEVRDKIYPQVASGFIVMENEQLAKEYKARATSCPTIVCLDGFVLQEGGSYGGKGGTKKTRLEDLRNSPHFGFQPSSDAEGPLQHLQKIDAQLTALSEFEASQRALQPPCADHRRRAEQLEAALVAKWGEDALRESEQEEATTQYQYQAAASYQTRKRSAEALDREGGATRARHGAAATAAGSSAPPGPVELTRGNGKRPAGAF